MQIHKVTIVLLVIALMSLFVSTASAQQEEAMLNTITVTGSGSASSTPDMATVTVGVELFGQDISSVYSEVNSAIASVTLALEEIGITDEDMRTTGLDVWVNNSPMGSGQMMSEIRISNRIHITIHDLQQIENVIDTAISNGANNIFGLQFGVSDNNALESEARINALADARSRAEEIATTLGVELGDVVSVVEYAGGNRPLNVLDNAMIGGGSGAVVEPGLVSVSMSVQVVYRFNN